MKKLSLSLVWSMLLAITSGYSQDFNLQLRSTMEFPGTSLANICGYASNGHEYALIGASSELIIVDVTDPDNPVNIVTIPGSHIGGREVKTYGHYAYVVCSCSDAILIVDLNTIHDPNPVYHYFTGLGQFPDSSAYVLSMHTLHIDVKKGFLYTFGGNLFPGNLVGAVVFDLNSDPYNPVFAGSFNPGYIHDGYVDNDTLYACDAGSQLFIVDMKDKSNPQLLGIASTPNIPHNAWLLEDGKHIMVSHEYGGAPVTSFDISDPQDVKELDRISPNHGTTPHNTHVINDWAVTSWYADGVVIIDAHKPDNLVITGMYDTWPDALPGYRGCWGVYPFLPSGTIVASNIPDFNPSTSEPGKLFVLTPDYLRACYLEGSVTDACTGVPVANVDIEINSGNPWAKTSTQIDGSFKTGQAESGVYDVTFSKPGYKPQTISASLKTGEVTVLNITLEANNTRNVGGTVIDQKTQLPVDNAYVLISSTLSNYSLQTNSNGKYHLDCVAGDSCQVFIQKWGHLPGYVNYDSSGIQTTELVTGYFDDFLFDFNWESQIENGTSGFWVRDEPIGTSLSGIYCNPVSDINIDNNRKCYITGNSSGSANSDDVDGGSVILTCPPMQLSTYEDAVLTFWYWFFNVGGLGIPPLFVPNDQLEVRVTGGNQTTTIFTETVSQSGWRYSGEIHLKDYVTLTDDIQVQFIATDNDPGHIVEAAVDYFQVVPKGSSTAANDTHLSGTLAAAPNPSSASFSIHYNWQGANNPVLEVRNPIGQVVFTQTLSGDSGVLSCGGQWPNGVYMAVLKNDGRQSAPLRLVKQ